MINETPDLFSYTTKAIRFDGPEIAKADTVRLTGQCLKVFDIMKHGGSWTLAQLSEASGYPQASISARIRDFRKHRFGSHTIERTNHGDGLFSYKLIVNPVSMPRLPL